MKIFITIYLVIYPLLCFAPPSEGNNKIEVDSQFVLDCYFKELSQKRQKIIRIANTIKQIESKSNYKIKGSSGEYGAYQFMPRTWKVFSIRYFGEVLDITDPENQDKVAQMYIEELINKGYDELQIASIWNCGSPKWQGKIGVNKFGVSYNVPKHVNKFKKAYNEIQKGNNFV